MMDSTQDTTRNPTPATPQEQDARSPDLSSLIHDIESHLGRAQQLAAQHQHEMEQVAKREANLLEREKEAQVRIADQERILAERDQQMQEERKTFQERSDKLTKACELLKSEADQARELAETLRSELEGRPTTEAFKQAQQDLDTALEHASEYEAQVRTLEEQSSQLRAEIKQRPTVEALEQAHQELLEARKQAKALEAKLKDHENAVDELKNELAQRPTQEILDDSVRELAAARKYSNSLEARIREDEDRISRMQSDLNNRPTAEEHAEATKQLELTRRRAEQLESRIEEQQERIRALQGELDAHPGMETLAQAQTDLNSARDQLGAAQTAQAELEARIDELQAELAERPTTDEITKARDDVDAAMEQASQYEAQVRQLEEQAQHNANHIKALEARLEDQADTTEVDTLNNAYQSAQTRISELEARLETAAASAPDPRLEAVQAQKLAEAEAALDTLRLELEARPSPDDVDRIRQERDDLAEQLESAHQTDGPGSAPAAEITKLEKEIAKRDLAVTALHEKLRQLQQAAQSDAQSPASSAAADPEAESRAVLRRDRLRRARQLIREREHDSRNVSAQIDEKRRQLNEYETTLTGLQRRLEAQQQQIASASTQQATTKSRGRASKNAGSVLLALVTCMAIMAGAGWAAASRVAVPTYAVQATLGMEGREDASSDELASWQEFHEAVFTDPQFLEDTAERMKRRGFRSLMNPADVRRFIEDSADITFAQEGEVSLTVRAEGLARSQRLMETFTTSYIAWSNSTRDLRLDNAALGIVSPISTDGDPVDDPRLMYFGAIFGGLATLTLLVFLMLQSHFMKRIKRLEAIEQDAKNAERIWMDATRGG